MRQRLISAAVLVPVVVIVFLLGRPWTSIGIAVVAALAAWETAQLVRAAGLPANRWLVVAAALGAAAAFELSQGPWFFGLESVAVICAAAAWIILAAVDGLTRSQPRDGFMAWAGTVVGSVYISMLPFAIGILNFTQDVTYFGEPPTTLFGLDRGRWLFLMLVLSVWALDSFAYLTGRYFGRGRFFPHISPNKTVSGAIGGAVAAIIACTALAGVGGLNPMIGLAIGGVIAVAAQAGDLAESMIKRAAGAKDSGTLIPGHGGFLDRVDSFVFAAPAVYAALFVLSLARVNVFI